MGWWEGDVDLVVVHSRDVISHPQPIGAFKRNLSLFPSVSLLERRTGNLDFHKPGFKSRK